MISTVSRSGMSAMASKGLAAARSSIFPRRALSGQVLRALHERIDAGQEDAFYVVDAGEIRAKHDQWTSLLPRVRPFYGASLARRPRMCPGVSWSSKPFIAPLCPHRKSLYTACLRPVLPTPRLPPPSPVHVFPHSYLLHPQLHPLRIHHLRPSTYGVHSTPNGSTITLLRTFARNTFIPRGPQLHLHTLDPYPHPLPRPRSYLSSPISLSILPPPPPPRLPSTQP